MALNAQLKEMERLMSAVDVAPKSRAAQPGSRAGPGGYGGRTFTTAQELEIQRNNAHLVNKLARVRGEGTSTYSATPTARTREGSAAINRRKKESQIERENARIVARIQSQKSTLSQMKPPPSMPKRTSGPANAPRRTGSHTGSAVARVSGM
mmetsp:Transcript_7864/g.19153  ORF Transcript_7864/g.19153 Transcript_7864/m.19153 type:complete len:152 (+) Transcript_7864:3-458(+)